jgi:hypothetical protein
MFSVLLVAASNRETRREWQILSFTFSGHFHGKFHFYACAAANRSVANMDVINYIAFL